MNYKQIKLSVAINMFISSATSAFLAISYLFSDKKRTATPFAILSFLDLVAGIVLISDRIKDHYDNEAIRSAIENINEAKNFEDLPIDEMADETEFC